MRNSEYDVHEFPSLHEGESDSLPVGPDGEWNTWDTYHYQDDTQDDNYDPMSWTEAAQALKRNQSSLHSAPANPPQKRTIHQVIGELDPNFAMSNSPIGRLPGELRNRVYEYTLPEDTPIKIDNALPILPALTQVCRLMRSETIALYFSSNVFEMTLEEDNADLVTKQLYCLARLQAGKYMRKLIIHCDSYAGEKLQKRMEACAVFLYAAGVCEEIIEWRFCSDDFSEDELSDDGLDDSRGKLLKISGELCMLKAGYTPTSPASNAADSRHCCERISGTAASKSSAPICGHVRDPIAAFRGYLELADAGAGTQLAESDEEAVVVMKWIKLSTGMAEANAQELFEFVGGDVLIAMWVLVNGWKVT